MRQFERYIGIDYSGAEAPVSRLRQLQVYSATDSTPPVAVPPFDQGARNWCRKEVSRYLHEALMEDSPCVIAVDHGFSFPQHYFERNRLSSWDEFLDHFAHHWPTHHDHMYVDFVRREDPPSGQATELRLCEQWTAGAKSVFHFDVQGSVAKSTHAGLPWLRSLRRNRKLARKLHFWPFDGFAVEPGMSVIAEAFPSLFRRRYAREARSVDQHDAYALAAWLKQMDHRGALVDYFNPPLTLPERRQAQLEGWILGVR